MASANKELEEELLEAGNKLFDPPSSIEDLLLLLFPPVEGVKGLKGLSALERDIDSTPSWLPCLGLVKLEGAYKGLNEPTESMQNALSPSLKALVDDKLIKHSDVDVKVAVTSCLIQLTRITAPDAPYNDDQMIILLYCSLQIMLLSFMVSFSFRRLFVVMLDLQCDALILEMFQNFFKTIREYHPEKVFFSMKTIMVLILEEGGLSEDTAFDLLSPIMDSLDNGNEVVLPIARKLGESVLQKCPTHLKTYSRQIAMLSLAHSRTARAA
ncbi:hypothetical protein TSUD_07810 [Trifolium subterraneum]|uniref:Uncharacterized protein n=1 Tax=Trifolium subterraneum TaxID=3900 RepID=A0A2Z6M6R7_TRISU|nr:hypothetical protein TSUD_07810 [Trifolium subterraneum]